MLFRSELIKDNGNGKLIKSDNDNGFDNSINLLIENKKLANYLCKNALEMIKPFRVENIKEELIKIYIKK